MGLAKALLSGFHAADPEHMSLITGIATSMEREQAAWIAQLREQGVKAAHPDDGWVDREQNSVTLCYPQFNDGAKAGDLVALGWPTWAGKDRYRIVRLTERVPSSMFGVSHEWFFQEVEVAHG